LEARERGMLNLLNRCDESKIWFLDEETLRTAIRGEVEDWRAFLQESEDGLGESEMWRRDVNKKKRLSQSGLCVQPPHGKFYFTCHTTAKVTTRTDERIQRKCNFHRDIRLVSTNDICLFQLFQYGNQLRCFKLFVY
jgi:hypothetical protein